MYSSQILSIVRSYEMNIDESYVNIIYIYISIHVTLQVDLIPRSLDLALRSEQQGLHEVNILEFDALQHLWVLQDRGHHELL